MEFEDSQFEFIDPASLIKLNHHQTVLYADYRKELIEFLRNKGKNPNRNRGYSESNIRPISRRIHQAFEFAWKSEPISITLSTEQANQFVKALNQDNFLKSKGDPYKEGSKRKFSEAVEAYYRYRDIDWEPKIKFSESQTNSSSDPFTRSEREKLLNASFEYRSPPTYSNTSPEERERWNRHLAQFLGKSKETIGPADWDSLNRCWKIPSLISTALDCGWRAAMVGRLQTSQVNIEESQINIPPSVAVKNNESWVAVLSSRSTKMLRRWIEQRDNHGKYDNSDNIWLNRKSNPYNSSTLNSLLSNLIEEAAISTDGRRLTWHSIRHSTGMYVYNKHRDLGLVADILRHSSLESARRYAHPTPESKKEVIQSIQWSETP